MRAILILVLLGLLPLGRGYGRDLTLDQALQMAREHSLQLKKAEAESQSAAELLRAARAERFPTLSATSVASFVDEIPQMQLGLPGLGSITRDLGTKESYQTDLRLSVPLYTGGRIKAAVRQAAFGRDYRQALERVQLDLLLYQTRLDYLGLYRSLKIKEATEASLQRTEIIRRDVASGFDAGIADSVDLLEADLSHSQASFAVEQAAIDIQAGRIRLAVRLGLRPGDDVSIADTLPDPTIGPIAATGENNRPELTAADAAVEASRARVAAEKSGYLPSLSLFGGYSYGKPNGNFFANEWRDHWTAGANLTWSFNLGFKTASRTRASAYDLTAARRQRDDLAESIARDVELAAEQVRLAQARFRTACQEYRITSENYRLARAQHHNGILSSNRLLEIETALTRAESSLAAAKVDYHIAQSGYLYACGSDQLGKGI